jgi:hypothetical protein
MGRVPQPTLTQVHLFTVINWALLVDALLGVAVLRGRWRQALALERAKPASGPLAQLPSGPSLRWLGAWHT